MRVKFTWHQYRYFPYERDLACRELAVMTGSPPVPELDGVSISVPSGWEPSAARTTYFSEAIAEDGSRIVPDQALLELSAHGHHTGNQGNRPESSALRRQSTRYSAHGLHTYRGKFNPQMVRAIGNILELQADDWVLDPFC